MTTLAPPPPPPRPSSNVVLLTHVPSFLKDSLRDWISPCGPTRTILKYEATTKKMEPFLGSGSASASATGSASATTSTVAASTASAAADGGSFTALVTMIHGDGACKLVCAVQKMSTDMKAHLVPASPDVLLPPISIEDNETLVQHLQTTFRPRRDRPLVVIDAQKVAAAAGGNNYDEEADPLNAPAVLEAVKQFRTSLETSQTTQQRPFAHL
jgi:hypothetical protein